MISNLKFRAMKGRLIMCCAAMFPLIVIFFACNPNTKNMTTMADETNKSAENSESADTTPRVTGIGGIFFFSDDPEKVKEWYSKNLGIKTNEWGASFEFRNARRPDEINYLQWSPFKSGSNYFAPSSKDFMINYRVQNIEGLVKKLKGNGVTILDKIETYEYGKFVHILDAEGNKIELWEPVDHVLTEMDGATNK
jgi:predicted enzyme related to lactoylglutathione lyase